MPITTRNSMLQSVYGQEVRMPDLNKILDGWKCDQNPQSDVVDNKVKRLIATYA